MPLPALPLLDDFNRPDEHPLSDGGNWSNWGTATQCWLTSHIVTIDPSSAVCWSQWQTTMAADQAVAGTIADWNRAGGDGGEFYIAACSDNIGSINYQYELDVGSPIAHPNYAFLRRSGSWVIPASLVGIPDPVAVGDQIAINVSGSTIEAWFARAGAWVLTQSADDFVLSGGLPPLGPGKPSIGVNGFPPTPRNPSWSAFYAGPGGFIGRLPLLGAG